MSKQQPLPEDIQLMYEWTASLKLHMDKIEAQELRAAYAWFSEVVGAALDGKELNT